MIVAEGIQDGAPFCPQCKLQWGRNLIVAEGWEEERVKTKVEASMGPQLDSCGRSRSKPGQAASHWLQWGRNLIVAEGCKVGNLLPNTPELQWGRNLIVAEGYQRKFAPILDRMLQWGRNLIVAEGGALGW